MFHQVSMTFFVFFCGYDGHSKSRNKRDGNVRQYACISAACLAFGGPLSAFFVIVGRRRNQTGRRKNKRHITNTQHKKHVRNADGRNQNLDMVCQNRKGVNRTDADVYHHGRQCAA